MTDSIWVMGDRTLEAVLKRHTSIPVEPFHQGIEGHPVVIIEPSLGPPSQKRHAVEYLANHYPGTMVLSASTTILLAKQQSWVGNRLKLWGFDPWLVAIDAKRLTIVGPDALKPAPWDHFYGWEWDRIEDSIGGVFARVIAPLVNEAMAYRALGLSDRDIDRAIRLGLNHPQGPFEWANLFGVSNIGLVLEAMRQALGESYFPHPEIMRCMAKEGVDWNA